MKLFIDYPPRIDQCVRGRLWKKFHWLPPTHWTMYESSWNFLEFYNISQYFTVFVKGSNLLNNNVNTVSLARTHRPMPSSFFEIGGNTPLARRLRLRVSGWYCPHLSGLRWHWPVRPRQTHGILSLLLTKLEAYSVQQGMHFWISGRV